MKQNKLIVLFATTLLFITACNSSPEKGISEDQKTEVKENTKIEVAEKDKVSRTYEISGMTCEFGCAKFIEEKVGAHNGVVAFNVNFEEETAEIVYDKSRTSSEEIIAYVGELNDGEYSMSEIEASATQPSKNHETMTDSAKIGSANTSAEVGS